MKKNKKKVVVTVKKVPLYGYTVSAVIPHASIPGRKTCYFGRDTAEEAEKEFRAMYRI